MNLTGDEKMNRITITYDDIKRNDKFVVAVTNAVVAVGGAIIKSSSGLLPYVDFTLPEGTVVDGLKYEPSDDGTYSAFWEDNR